MPRILLTALAAALIYLAAGAGPASAKGLLPPKTWEGTVQGTSLAHPSVGTTTRWTANVTFDLASASRKKRLYQYGGTGSVTYTISGGNDCTSSGTVTFGISDEEAALSVLHARSGWKYGIDIGVTDEDWIGQVQCPDQPGPEDETEYIPPVLLTDRKDRPAPRGLDSLSGTYHEAGNYTTSWSFSGSPRKD